MVISFARTKDFKSEDPESDASTRLVAAELDAARQRELVKWFQHTPAVFWTKTCVLHNGFFGVHTSRENAPASSKTSVSSPEPESSSTAQTRTPLPDERAEFGQQTVSTYFRLIVKMLELPEANGQAPTLSASNKKEKDYTWHEMGFMSFSSDSRSTILCFDVPKVVITGLKDVLCASAEQYGGPFGLHVPLLEELVKLYDGSVWGMRDILRDREKVS